MEILNKKARHDYFIEKTYTAGLVLKGHEVKSIRSGNMSIKEGFVRIIKGEAFFLNCYIKKYEHINTFYKDIDEKRTIKLLLKKKEIRNIEDSLNVDGYTAVPLKIFFNEKNKCKLEFGIGKGKKHFDKRNDLKDRNNQRDIDVALKERSKEY
jgi:SsrA-binding protein